NPRNSEGDTILLADGRLLLAWTRFDGREDHARAGIWGIESVDWGETWGPPRVLVSPEEARQNVMSVSLLREAKTGHLLLFYLRKNGPDDCQVRVVRSQDEGQTWSDSLRVSTEDGYHVMNNARVIQLESGRLLAPVARVEHIERAPLARDLCYLSDDGGETWRPSEEGVQLPGPYGGQEPGLVETANGVLMYLRTLLGHVYGAWSRDGGENWGAPFCWEALPAPAAPATMARMPDGSLVILYNHREDGATAGWKDRTPLAAARSVDDGQTWQRLGDVEGSADYCYAYTSFRVYDQRVVLTYYVWPRSVEHGFDQTTLRFRMVPLESLCG
ncbi:MAG: exo-alpha-sialidase, partial [Chloroflexi bacterium]|nr:exo-alpha-sialidase [Chloroflexota bacterium]